MAADDGLFVLENAIAMRMWPHNPGGRWREGGGVGGVGINEGECCICVKLQRI